MLIDKSIKIKIKKHERFDSTLSHLQHNTIIK